MKCKLTEVDSLKLFIDSIKDTILDFQGCEQLEILNDKDDRTIFFSYSTWQSENDLNNYRASDFFEGTWSKVKEHLSEGAKAWTVEKV